MTWEPKNKTDDDDDDDAGSSECEDKDKDDMLMGDEKHCNKDVRKGRYRRYLGAQPILHFIRVYNIRPAVSALKLPNILLSS